MRKLSEEKRAWLNSESAQEMRKHYAGKATEQANLLMAKAMTSTDPEMRTHAAAYAAWHAAYKELDPQHDPD
jgi:hypothetical protein